jgi:hypothetical protein
VSNGITYTPNPDGSFTVNGTATADSQIRITVYGLCGGTFTLSGLSQAGSNDTWFMRLVDNAANALGNCINKYTYNVPAGNIQWLFRVKAGTTVNNLVVSPMLNAGSTAAPYRPPREPISSTIPETVQALDGYGCGINESVYNYVDFEKQQFVKSDATKTLKGSETWVLVSGSGVTPYFYHVLGTYGTVIPNAVLCNDYKTVTIGSSTKEEGIYVTNSSAYKGATLYVRDLRFATVDEWKAHLAENPLTIYYGVATPIVTDITDLVKDFDNLIPVEGGGTIVFENEHKIAIPSKIVYQLKGVVT